MTEQMFYHEPAPWMQVGSPVNAKTSATAMRQAGINWEVAIGPLFGGPDKKHLARYEGRYSVYRTDTGAVLGDVSRIYEVFQNAEAVSLLDPLAQQGVLRYVAGGELLGGKVVWLQAQLAEVLHVADDDYAQFMLVTTRHDACGKVRCLTIDERLVCGNMLNWAIAKGNEASVAISHNPKNREKLLDAQRALAVTQESNLRLTSWLGKAAVAKAPESMVREVQTALFGEIDDATSAQRLAAVEKFSEIYHAEAERVGETAYALVQAITGFADHEFRYNGTDAKKNETRFLSVTSGEGASMHFKTKGIGVVSTLANL